MAGAQERTEKPTGKRLAEARRKGNVPKSQELTSLAVLCAGWLAASFQIKKFPEQFRALLDQLWPHGFALPESGLSGKALAVSVFQAFFLMAAPGILAALATAVAVNLVQLKGFLFAPKALEPKFSKLNPLNGLKRFAQVRFFAETAKSFLKILIIGCVLYSVFQSERESLATLVHHDLFGIGRETGRIVFRFVWKAGAFILVLAILDFAYQRWQYIKDLMMTKQEVKEEHKQSEGNPQIKSRIRSIQRTLARQRMMSKVPRATVVVTNPTHYAVALFYKEGLQAPKVVAKGMNLIAQNIIRIAREHRVPVVQNPPLARALYHQVKLDQVIPETLYRAVAKVLAYVYQQRRSTP
ncbi:MAG: flagellar biosynthesis protein FlhB [Desulfosoma sp.]